MAEEQIYRVALGIHQKYSERELAQDGHGIWELSGDCLNQLINPFDRHPLAARLMETMIDYYCEQYAAAHGAA